MRLERTARILAVVVLAWLVWSAAHPVARARSARARLADVARFGPAWAPDAALVSLHVALDTTPDRASLDLLAALRRAGTAITWDGPLPPMAVVAEPLPEPSGGTRVSIAGRAGMMLHVTDAVGAIDSVRPGGAGAELFVKNVEPPVRVASGAIGASAGVVDSLTLRPVLVLGRAGWESKFVVAALEERGWRVMAQLSVAPGARVGQGNTAPIDTARYSAVVVLDSAAAPWADAIARYVRSGGGLVLAGATATLPALAPLAPATLGAHRAARPALVADSVAPRTLARWSLRALREGATPLARYGAEVALAARVAGAGRVVQTGAEESWRWRLAGPEGSAEAHREWWSHLVAAVAYAPATARGDRHDAMPAPLARVTDALGASGAAAVASTPFDPMRSPLALTIMLVVLLAEWGSRRLRGAR